MLFKIAEKMTQGIYIFGMGIRSISQITLETNYLLQQMDTIFHVSSDERVSDYISSLGVEEVNLSNLYQEKKKRELVYQNICDTIVKATTGKKKNAYLTSGNPVFLNTVVRKLNLLAKKEDINVNIYPGVSSIDTIINDILLPVGLTGVQCYECTQFLRLSPILDSRVPLLLFQPGVINDYKIRKVVEGNYNGVELLQKTLIDIYGTNQKWLLINSSDSNVQSSLLSNGVLSELKEKSHIFNRGTLLITGAWSYK